MKIVWELCPSLPGMQKYRRGRMDKRWNGEVWERPGAGFAKWWPKKGEKGNLSAVSSACEDATGFFSRLFLDCCPVVLWWKRKWKATLRTSNYNSSKKVSKRLLNFQAGNYFLQKKVFCELWVLEFCPGGSCCHFSAAVQAQRDASRNALSFYREAISCVIRTSTRVERRSLHFSSQFKKCYFNLSAAIWRRLRTIQWWRRSGGSFEWLISFWFFFALSLFAPLHHRLIGIYRRPKKFRIQKALLIFPIPTLGEYLTC